MDVYYWNIKPSFLFEPWECENIRKQDIIIEDIKEGWVKYTKYSGVSTIMFTEILPVHIFKNRFTRRI